MTYDPKSALKVLQSHLGQQATPRGAPLKIVTGNADVAPQPMVRADGTPLVDVALAPRLCCVLLLAFTNRMPGVPDDFDAVPRTADGLKAHVRPDGGVYLGAFEAPRDAAGTVLVYGPVDTDPRTAVKASQWYRGQLLQQMEREPAQRPEPGSVFSPLASEKPTLPS